MVPEPQDAVARAMKPVVADLVLRRLKMVPTVHLDDQPAPEAGEVHDVGADRNLTAKMKSESTQAKMTP